MKSLLFLSLLLSLGAVFTLGLKFRHGGISTRSRLYYSNVDDERPQPRTFLFSELKAWRKRTADEIQQPLYRVLSNACLELITREKPTTKAQLGYIVGIGPTKLDKYGDAIIKLVHENSNKNATNARTGPSAIGPTKPKAPRRSRIKALSAKEEAMMDCFEYHLDELNIEQKKAATSAIENRNNIFITGSAGTGKTYLLKYVIQELVKKYESEDGVEEGSGATAVAVTAPTGISAINVGGQTIHSFAGIGLGNGDVDKIILKVINNKCSKERWEKCKVLIIDEISMIPVALFELLDSVAREVKGNDMPFGGIQIIAVGDFLQLPPVQKGDDKTFCFQSHVWEACGFNTRSGTFILDIVERQKDKSMVKFLNEVRLGSMSPEFQAVLNACLINSKPKPTNGIVPTKLYSVNREVDKENENRLAEIDEPVVTITAEDRFKVVPQKKVPFSLYADSLNQLIPEKIDLKIGAQVMLLRNRSRQTFAGVVKGSSASLVNGSRGKVVGFSESILKKGMMVPTIEFDNGVVVTIGPVEYLYKIPNTADGVIVRFQVPLKLAWAATIHKSQGCTISMAELMLGNTFDYGQAYVALSRVKDFKGMWLSEPINSDAVKACPQVLDFYGY